MLQLSIHRRDGRLSLVHSISLLLLPQLTHSSLDHLLIEPFAPSFADHSLAHSKMPQLTQPQPAIGSDESSMLSTSAPSSGNEDWITEVLFTPLRRSCNLLPPRSTWPWTARDGREISWVLRKSRILNKRVDLSSCPWLSRIVQAYKSMRSLYGLTIGSGCSCVGMRLMFANDANVRLEGVGWAYHKWNKMCQLWELLWKFLREHFGGNHCYQPTSFRKEINHMTQTTAGTVFFLVPRLLTSQDSHAEALPMAQQALRSTQ